MHRVTIEIKRSGKAHGEALSKDNIYIASCEGQPDNDLSIKCDQSEFNEYKEMLRYGANDETARQKAISFFQGLMTKVFDDIDSLRVEGNKSPEEWLHLRLLISAVELVQLPFELTLTPKGFEGQSLRPFLVNPQRLTTLTREVRQVSSPNYTWPVRPRILFAWAEPAEQVPHEEHLGALCEIAKELVCPIEHSPEPIPDNGQLVTPLENASLNSIAATIKSAIDAGRPYTHIHLLAHGSQENDNNAPKDFKLLLHDNDDSSKVYYASGDELAKKILQIDGNRARIPALLSLMTCDSGNTGSITLPSGSITHQLHQSGIPCVFASQFPLSTKGSVKLVKALYGELLLKGEDPRKALYLTREAIEDKKLHDWASLIAYVRFPQDIDEQLKDYRLKVLLESLKTSNAWSEHIQKHRKDIKVNKLESILENITDRLDKSINDLNRLFTQGRSRKVNKARFAEHAGLMGSAYKRKAEHLFRLASFKPEMSEALLKKSKEALKASREWYLNGFAKNHPSHWTAVQYLSLTSVIQGSFQDDEKDVWIGAKLGAEDQQDDDNSAMDRIWAWGSLTELYLLKPFTFPPEEFDKQMPAALSKAKEYAVKISKAKSTFLSDPDASTEDIDFARESTARQLDRYILWWPQMMPSSQMERLKNMAIEIKKTLVGSI